MKKMIRTICITIILAIFVTTPVLAEEISTYSSPFFASYDSFITVTTSNSLEIWFDAVGNGTMDEIGVERIELERSSNRTEWTTVRIFYPEDYPQMIKTNTGINYDYVSCNATGGYFYRAYVVFYATSSRGMGNEYDYAETVYVPRPSEPINSVVDSPVLG